MDWRIGGVQREYRVCVEKKNEEAGMRIFVHPKQLIYMVCYRALIEAPPSAADHTWFSNFTLKVDRDRRGADR